MPTLRIYFDVYFDIDLYNLEKKICSDKSNYAILDSNNILESGFFKASNEDLFLKLPNSYYIVNYIEKEIRLLPSINSELAYYGLSVKSNYSEEVSYPILIKLIINKNKSFLCFYSRQIIRNEKANELLNKLHSNYGFKFKYSLIDNHVRFKKNELDNFLNILDLKDFTEISIYDKDNELIVKNSSTLTETKKVISIFKEMDTGNWSYVKLLNKDINFEIRISNNKTQNYITFENNYIDDIHLINCVDYLISKIREADISYNKNRQINIDYYFH